MSHKLIIDLVKCKPQGTTGVHCSYKHHPENKGIDALLEMSRFALICRRCDGAPCVQACPQGALSKEADQEGQSDGVLKRAKMLCTGCGTCTLACPFGTLVSDLIPFASSVCDVCRNRLEADEKPLCVKTCPDGSIDYSDDPVGEDAVEVFDDIVVRVEGGQPWEPLLQRKA